MCCVKCLLDFSQSKPIKIIAVEVPLPDAELVLSRQVDEEDPITVTHRFTFFGLPKVPSTHIEHKSAGAEFCDCLEE